MIHSIAVSGGESEEARLAQRHAVQFARLFQAQLRVFLTWEADDAARARAEGASEEILQALVDEETEEISVETGTTTLAVERNIYRGGLVEGGLMAASESDLIVVGLADTETEERALLERADCMVLAVHLPPVHLRRILVDFQGGREGKAALRIAGEIARRAGAAVTVLCVSGDIAEAGTLAATAERYLAAFGLTAVDKIEHRGSPTSENAVLQAANSVNADLIVVGQERPGTFFGLSGRATLDGETLAADITIPVLIAR